MEQKSYARGHGLFLGLFIINFLFLFSQESKSTLLQYLTFKSNVFTNTKDSFWTFSILSPCTTVLKPILKTKTLCRAQLWLVARLPLGKLNSKISNSFEIFTSFFPLIILKQTLVCILVCTHQAAGLNWILGAIWPLNQLFNFKNQSILPFTFIQIAKYDMWLETVWKRQKEAFLFRLIFFEEIATYTVLDSTLNLYLNSINNLQDSLFWKYTDF